MKNILTTGAFLGLVMFLITACHDVTVPVNTELTPDIFPQNSSQFIQASGPPYAALRGNFSLDYWFMQSLSTDEAILPARGVTGMIIRDTSCCTTTTGRKITAQRIVPGVGYRP
ncbi:hypothetical protein [Spirosoma telluris]|uniref:hypothetical protein n=1 Tax=Spirosoma telluris TaxID=2183553 RepID=UPI002FC39185